MNSSSSVCANPLANALGYATILAMTNLLRALCVAVSLAAATPAQTIGWLSYGTLPGNTDPSLPVLLAAAPGGLVAVSGDVTHPLSVYRSSGSAWTLQGTTSFPIDHRIVQVVYDVARATTVVRFRRTNPLLLTQLTMEWDGVAWRTVDNLLHGGRTPFINGAPATQYPFAYDPVTQQCLLYDGLDVFTLIAAGWTRLPLVTTPVNPQLPPFNVNYPGQQVGAWVFNPLTQRMFLVDRFDMGSSTAWEFDTTTLSWTWLSTSQAYFGAALVFDPSINRMINSGAGEWDGAQWRSVCCYGPMKAYDAQAQRLVGYGGHNGYSLTYAERGGPQGNITEYGTGCPGAYGMPQLVFPWGFVRVGPGGGDVDLVNIPPVGLSFPFLCLGLTQASQPTSAFGFPGCLVNQSMELFMMGPMHGAWPWSRWFVPIPTWNPQFFGTTFYMQGFCLELGSPLWRLSTSRSYACQIGRP